jgi:hypothetical protein
MNQDLVNKVILMLEKEIFLRGAWAKNAMHDNNKELYINELDTLRVIKKQVENLLDK